MAIYHLHAAVGGRGGAPAASKAAYISRAGRYARGREDLAAVRHGNMPSWAAADPGAYWRAADLRERSNGTLYRSVEVALPLELSAEERVRLAEAWAESVADVEGEGGRLPYTLAVHDAEGNPHAHLMLSERIHDGHDRTPEEWFRRAPKGARKRDLGRSADRQAWLAQLREGWEDLVNSHLARAGHSARIDHRSHEARGIGEAPGEHLGPRVLAMARKGTTTERGQVVAATAAAEAARPSVRAELEAELAAWRPHPLQGADLRQVALERVLGPVWERSSACRREIAQKARLSAREALLARLTAEVELHPAHGRGGLWRAVWRSQASDYDALEVRRETAEALLSSWERWASAQVREVAQDQRLAELQLGGEIHAEAERLAAEIREVEEERRRLLAELDSLDEVEPEDGPSMV